MVYLPAQKASLSDPPCPLVGVPVAILSLTYPPSSPPSISLSNTPSFRGHPRPAGAGGELVKDASALPTHAISRQPTPPRFGGIQRSSAPRLLRRASRGGSRTAPTRPTWSFPRRREGGFTFEVQHWGKHKRRPHWGSRSAGTCEECCCSVGRRRRVPEGVGWPNRFCGGGGGACGR